MSTHIGFTGTQLGMTDGQKKELARVLKILLKARGTEMVFHDGMCHGADDEAAMIAGNLGYRLVGHPGPQVNRDAIVVHHEVLEILPNLVRNHVIVDVVEVMIAAPAGQTEVLRSGTWSTIRYTKKVEKPLLLIYPEGETTKTSFVPSRARGRDLT